MFEFNGKQYKFKNSMKKAMIKQALNDSINMNSIKTKQPLKQSQAVRKAKLLKNLEASTKSFKVTERSALKGKFKEHLMKEIPTDHKQKIKDFMLQEYLRNDQYKVNAFLGLKYTMSDKDTEYVRYHTQKYKAMTSPTQINQYVDTFYDTLSNSIEEATNKSNLLKPEFNLFQINFNFAKPNIKPGSYFKLPKYIELKQACINIKNTKDDKCLIWAMLAQLHYATNPKTNKDSLMYYKQFEKEIIQPEDQNFPIDIENDIPQFEELNDIKINVFEYIEEGKQINVIYNSGERNKNVINILQVTEDDKSHLVWIKDLSKLLNTDTTVNKNKRYHCDNCLSASYTTPEALNNHQDYCLVNESCRAVFPPKDKSTLKFRNHNNEFKHPFAIFADFESTLLDHEEKVGENTERYQKHVPNSFGLYYKCIHDEHSEAPFLFSDPNPEKVNEQFILKLEEYTQKSFKISKKFVNKKVFKEGDKDKHDACTECMNCETEFTDDNKKVLHHDHITSYYISTLCETCNKEFRYKRFIPVYLHNLRGYDSHLFITALYRYGYKHDKSDNITCIPNNQERYLSMSKKIKVGTSKDPKTGKMNDLYYEIRFLDTFQFMASSLESLSTNLKSECKSVSDLRQTFPNTQKYFQNDTQFELMTQKGIYPYDFVSSYDKLNSKALPKQEEFYSKLMSASCSDEDYKRAQNVFKVFKCNSFMDYHNVYLKSDVLILADIWENFRNTCYDNYKLDPAYYFTAPGLSWDAFLKQTKVELELLTDENMYLFVESGIRGGISQISTRYAKANNKYMKNYDPKVEDSYIAYLDANNLYGYAMCEHLPQKDFKWNTEDWSAKRIMKLDDKASTGYLFSVDLEYPKELHALHNEYPLCPQNIAIKAKYLNGHQQVDYKESKIKKLCTTLIDKKKYTVNYRYLKLALSLGLKLTKVHKVLQYTQSDFMKPYIMHNTFLRTKAKNEFEKDFFKLMNNSCFGKTMENVRNRITFKLVTTEGEAYNLKNLKSSTIFDEDLVGAHIQKTKVCLNKPIYIGQNVLDQSKVLMYDFHYNFMLKKIPLDKINLLFTDTDSLAYHIRTHDIFEIMNENKDLFDLSNYDKNDKLYDPINKKVIGKFKNEVAESQITEFVGLRSKLYAYTTDADTVSKKCKGVKTNVVKQDVTFNEYKQALFEKKIIKKKQNTIASVKHQLYTQTTEKVALSGRDDKRFIHDDNIHTNSFGFNI